MAILGLMSGRMPGQGNKACSRRSWEQLLPNSDLKHVTVNGRETEIHYVHSASLAERERARERERERFTMSIQPAWLVRTGLFSCLSLLQQGNETMADRLLVLVLHE